MNSYTGQKSIYFAILLILLVVVGVFFSYKYFYSKIESKENSAVVSKPEEEESVFEPMLVFIPQPPKHLSIKERNIEVDTVEVGVLKDGSLDVPPKWNEAGWYKDGAKPGEVGNVIINAHFDDNYGRPAAFWQLKNAAVGDTVLIEDSIGRFYAYQIVDSFLVDINDPDRAKVFDKEEGKKTLTLITCGGIWLSGQSTYDKRLVVKAELISTL